MNDSGSTDDVVTPKVAEFSGNNKKSLKNDVKATTMSSNVLDFTETVDLQLGSH